MPSCFGMPWIRESPEKDHKRDKRIYREKPMARDGIGERLPGVTCECLIRLGTIVN